MTYKASSVATTSYGDSWTEPVLIEKGDMVLGNLSSDITTAALTDSNTMFFILANNVQYLKSRQSTANQTFTLSAAATSGINTIQTYVDDWPKEINHTYTISVSDSTNGGFQTGILTLEGFYGNGSIILNDRRQATSIGTGATTEGFGSITIRDCSISEIKMVHTSTTTAPLTFFASSVGSLLIIDNVKSKVRLRNAYFYNGDTASVTARCVGISNSQDVNFEGGTSAFTIGMGGYTGVEIYGNSNVMFDSVTQSSAAASTNYGLHLYDNSDITNGSTSVSTFSGNVKNLFIEKGGAYKLFDVIVLSAWKTINN